MSNLRVPGFAAMLVFTDTIVLRAVIGVPCMLLLISRPRLSIWRLVTTRHSNNRLNSNYIIDYNRSSVASHMHDQQATVDHVHASLRLTQIGPFSMHIDMKSTVTCSLTFAWQ
jgi:hypothetical protein